MRTSDELLEDGYIKKVRERRDRVITTVFVKKFSDISKVVVQRSSISNDTDITKEVEYEIHGDLERVLVCLRYVILVPVEGEYIRLGNMLEPIDATMEHKLHYYSDVYFGGIDNFQSKLFDSKLLSKLPFKVKYILSSAHIALMILTTVMYLICN